ncbi:alpha/beta fold hydrolase [Aggregatimonas sangjinii]|uniref:Alpha/beta fold hydrolase n=1 Tax=Aggregatimonas sangjinii TaxID=2583587 RepID=A0A5B7SV75_9FLAO|nr:alpha/beta fold hydrolase [Aggregatimonas sangjinii]QCX02102.1 alpha/beta fold hydrolase [Aggregatimonas sangjinii]
MPVIPSTYNPPFLFKKGHLSTIYAGIWRKISDFEQKRERIDLPDGDFLDLDWSISVSRTQKVVVLIHGLEGNAQRAYITGSAKAFNQNGYDVCAMNLRSCSGVPNRLYRSYHSGATEDLDAVIQHILTLDKYAEIYIKGFSLGGNMTLKYLGEGRELPEEIKAGIGISVPCNLHSSLKELLKYKNIPYAIRFKKHLVAKLREKQRLFPEKISDTDIKNVITLKDFDDIYTSRAHGFKDALDYYEKCSCLQFLPNIKIPALLLNAKNDSFLGPECYPYQEAHSNPHLYLEVSAYGGHVGYFGSKNTTYSEKRAIKFIEEVL